MSAYLFALLTVLCRAVLCPAEHRGSAQEDPGPDEG
jgi:hypothetical protein